MNLYPPDLYRSLFLMLFCFDRIIYVAEANSLNILNLFTIQIKQFELRVIE